MVCPPVRGDNPRASASLLSSVHLDIFMKMKMKMSKCTEDKRLAEARGLSPRTGGQTIV